MRGSMVEAHKFVGAVAVVALAGLAGAALEGAANAQAAHAAVDFKPHRAVYDITFDHATPGSGVADMSGRMVYELTGGRVITNLYIYETGSSQGSSVISSVMYPNETHTEYGLAPGSYIIEAEIDYGVETAIDSEEIEEGTWHTLWIMDGDIL